MKAIIISDIHGSFDKAEEVISRHPDAEYLLFLGDGERDFERLAECNPKMGFLGVKGNCDGWLFRSDDGLPESRCVTLGGVRIYMTHGHRCGTTDPALGYMAYQNGAEVAMCGHTHIPHVGEYTVSDGKRIVTFNPGSIGSPRGGSTSSYGIMEIKNGGFTLKYYEY